jgi:hypothetical protein
MPPVGFEPTIPASARPQTHALDRAPTGIGMHNVIGMDKMYLEPLHVFRQIN